MRPANDLAPEGLAAAGMGASSERVTAWGTDGHLSGIWTPARTPVQKPAAVLFFNAGVIHRIGAHRMNVKLARALAVRGWPCARFDLGGQGDSPPARDALDYRTQSEREIRAVIDAIEREHGISQVLIFGLCSGAVHAQAVALQDPRVRGVFLVDGYIYPTGRTRWRFVSRMIQAYGLRGFASRLWRFVRQRRASVPAGGALTPDLPDGAIGEGLERTRQEFAADMGTLTARGVGVSLLFTGSVLDHFAYAQQLSDAFAGEDWLSSVQCVFAPELDHTMTTRAAQQRVMDEVLAWAERCASMDHPVR